MKTFKSYLIEYLTHDQRRRFSQYKMNDKARSDTDHFFGVGNDKVTGSLDHMTDKSEIHKKIERHLGTDISHDEYRAGTARDKYGRNVRMGRMIKDDNLKAEYSKDPTREGVRRGSQYTTSTVRGVDVAGQTNPEPDEHHPTGHSWPSSCKNIETGIKRHMLQHDIERGTVVHFVHDHNGQEIYRATLHPHHNEEGHVAYGVDAEYGIKHPLFTKSAHDTAKALSGEMRGSPLYTKDDKIYNDSGITHMIHPSASSSDLDKITYDQGWKVRAAALRHPNATVAHVDNGIHDTNREVRKVAAASPLATNDHLNKILDDPNENHRVQGAAVSNLNATTEHITKGLKHEDPYIQVKAIQNPNATEHHIAMALDPKNDRSVQLAALDHKRANPSHLDKVLSNNPRVMDSNTMKLQVKAAGHPKASSENLHKALDSKDPDVREAAINNPNATKEHIQRGIDDVNPLVRISARYAQSGNQF